MTRRSLWALGAVTALECALLWAQRSEGRALFARREPLGAVALCQSYRGLPAGFPQEPAAGMVRIRGGRFVPGSKQGYAEEQPGGEVDVKDFLIDRTEVTNAQFKAFVAATGYVTLAERRGSAPVFHSPSEEELVQDPYAFWRLAPGANFRHPDGPDSSIEGEDNLPVVQLAYEDAAAYADWLGRTLPSEAQWELAARAGRHDADLHKQPRSPEGHPLANFWQGQFPQQNSKEDGFEARAPVGCFPDNPFGLHDMVGNVWEWTREAYRGSHKAAQSRPAAAERASTPRVIKGGSFLCSSNFCTRYRVSARHRQEPDMTGPHLGFRTVRELP